MTATPHDAFAGSILDLCSGAHAMNANLFDRLDRSIVNSAKAACSAPSKFPWQCPSDCFLRGKMP